MISHTPLPGERADALVIAYRRMVGWFALQLVAVATVVVPFANAARSHPALGRARVLLFTATLWASAAGIAYFAFRAAKALGSPKGWTYAGLISMSYAFAFVTSLHPDWAELAAPITQVVSMIGFLALLGLSATATHACKAAGIPVGLLGPRRPKPPRA